MICPHCHRTIREEQQGLMSRRSEEPLIPLATALGLLTLIVLVVLVLARVTS